MQVSVEAPSALERRITVRVPADQVDQAIRSRLQTLAKKARVDGFRPGKVPPKVMQRLYGQQAWLDSASELMQKSLGAALNQERLQPLTQPEIDPKPRQEGEDFEYSATFEIAPPIEVTGLETIQVVRPVAEVTDQDVETMIERLRWQHADWNAVDRPAAANDRITIDFSGQIDGQEFPDGKRENAQFMLDGQSLFKDFEAQMFGLSAGAETEFDLPLPENYPNPDLAGKQAHFQVKLHTVEAATLPEVDDVFAAKFEVEGVDQFRTGLRTNMEHNLREQIKFIVKRQVVQGLLQANKVPMSRPLVDAEIQHIAAGRIHFPDSLSDEQKLEIQRQMFGLQAYQRVAIGLIMSALAHREGFQIDEQRVRQILEAQALVVESPETMIQTYEENPEMMNAVRSLALEEQIVDWVVERAQITDRPSTFFDVVDPGHRRLPGEVSAEPDEAQAAALTGPESATHE